MQKILMLVENEIIPSGRNQYIEEAKLFAEDSSQNDQGCLGMWVVEGGDETRVTIASLWQNEEASRNAQAFTRHKAKLKPFFVSNSTTILKEL